MNKTIFSSNAVCQTVRKRFKPSSMELKSRPLFAFFRDPRRRLPRALSLQGSGIAAHGGKRSKIGFEEIVAKPATKRGMLSSSLSLDLAGGRQVVIPAVNTAAANSFAEAVEQTW
jgi:DNA helicase-4